eukprot:CAMPEP_0197887796 /NCGR_PEP_ID=MMETSP1439-20131203/19614_1 /TAXON_ID=66791 /ORGANISM="Gonyaulax spinifera, Strain CCMP409" /LENGTH=227 /DNA_ID=CAMNT_0043507651 /DNA_START=69 /DNA_END=752 /DNA_ORIENTATION=+
MANSRTLAACGAAAVCLVAAQEMATFVMPSTGVRAPLPGFAYGVATSGMDASAGGSSWRIGAAGIAIGAHLGLAAALYGRTALKAAAAAKETKPVKYVESAADKRLFEQVYMDYTSEYLKGPMYWHEDKLQGFLPDYPGTPMFKNGKMTSNATGNLKTFSSNELGYLSILFLAIGLYGNLMFNVYDPQIPKVDAGENFNVSYIVEALFLPISFFMHIAAYIQKKNGK